VEYQAAPDALYDVLVDAQSGRILQRANLVKFAADTASVGENYPGAAYGGSAQPQNLGQWLPGGANTLDGLNVDVYSNTADNADPDSVDAVGRHAQGTFVYPLAFSQTTDTGCTTATLCTWYLGDPSTWAEDRDQTAVQSFYFANKYHDHLAADPIDFTSADGAFDSGAASIGPADPLQLNSDDGAAEIGTANATGYINNANMATPWGGSSPLTNMSLCG